MTAAARAALLVAAATVVVAAAIVASACGGDSKSEPDRLIVYEARSAVNDEATEYSNETDVKQATNVYTIDAKSGKTTQLTHGKSFDGHPAWSPDYEQIIFASDRDDVAGKQDIYLMDADGGNQHPLVSTKGVAEWTPKFSHDGTQITYIQVNDAGGSYIMLMNADGSDQHRIAGPYVFAEFPAWRRDKREVYFAAIAQGKNDIDLYAWNAETETMRTIISTPGSDVCPHFTRDGKSMTYASAASGDENAGNVDLFEHDLSSDDTTGANDKRLTTDPGIDDYGNPSPDGKSFVFLSDRDGNTELYLMDRNGSNQRRLTTTPGARENVPDW